MEYIFEPERVFNTISKDLKAFLAKLKVENVVIGISGGKDSTVVAGCLAKILGPKHVYGVSMPCDVQKDISDVDLLFDTLSINRIDINIGTAFHSIVDAIENNAIDVTSDTRINLQPRLRMSTLYAVAQSVNGIVINTDNFCEGILGYSTLWGDSVGSYAPIQRLTVPEVVELGLWLGLPETLVKKIPSDGLQSQGDEERMGITYKAVHDLIRFGKEHVSHDEYVKITDRFYRNKFKLDMINLPGPEFSYLPIAFI